MELLTGRTSLFAYLQLALQPSLKHLVLFLATVQFVYIVFRLSLFYCEAPLNVGCGWVGGKAL